MKRGRKKSKTEETREKEKDGEGEKLLSRELPFSLVRHGPFRDSTGGA